MKKKITFLLALLLLSSCSLFGSNENGNSDNGQSTPITFEDNTRTILEKFGDPDDETDNSYIYFKYSSSSFYKKWKKMNQLLNSDKLSDSTKADSIYEEIKGKSCVLLYIEFDKTNKNVSKAYKDYNWSFTLLDFTQHNKNRVVQNIELFDKLCINYYFDPSSESNIALDERIKVSYYASFDDQSYVLSSAFANVNFNSGNSADLLWEDEFNSYNQTIPAKKIGEINKEKEITQWDSNYDFHYGEFTLSENILTNKAFWKESDNYYYIPFDHKVDGERMKDNYLVAVKNKKEITVDSLITYIVPGAFSNVSKLRAVIIEGQEKAYYSEQNYTVIPSYAFKDAPNVKSIFLTGFFTIKDYAFDGAPNAQIYLSSNSHSQTMIREANYASNVDGTYHDVYGGYTLERFRELTPPDCYSVYYSGTLLYTISTYENLELNELFDKVECPNDSGEQWVIGSFEVLLEDGEKGIYDYNILSWHNGTEGIELVQNEDNYYISGYSGNEKKVILPTKILINNEIIPLNDLEIIEYAFQNKEFEEIEMMNNVKVIREGAFSNNINLKKVIIPRSVKTIGTSAFMNCTSLTSIIIPNSVTKIGSFAFKSCTSLTIYCEAKSLPDSWSSIWNSSNCPVVWGYKG